MALTALVILFWQQSISISSNWRQWVLLNHLTKQKSRKLRAHHHWVVLKLAQEDACWGHGTNLERHDTIGNWRIQKRENFHAVEWHVSFVRTTLLISYSSSGGGCALAEVQLLIHGAGVLTNCRTNQTKPPHQTKHMLSKAFPFRLRQLINSWINYVGKDKNVQYFYPD